MPAGCQWAGGPGPLWRPSSRLAGEPMRGASGFRQLAGFSGLPLVCACLFSGCVCARLCQSHVGRMHVFCCLRRPDAGPLAARAELGRTVVTTVQSVVSAHHRGFSGSGSTKYVAGRRCVVSLVSVCVVPSSLQANTISLFQQYRSHCSKRAIVAETGTRRTVASASLHLWRSILASAAVCEHNCM